MAISRRKFINAGTLVALAAAIPLKATAKILNGVGSLGAAPTLSDRVSYLDMNMFSSCLQTDFYLNRGAAGAATVKLTEVHDWRTDNSGKECFSLMFRGSETTRLAQDTYQVEHGALGKFEMLLVPVGKRSGRYEAVFNRSV